MSRKEILAIHKAKLEEFLRELELWEPLAKGELKCFACGNTISADSIGFVVPSKKGILLCCRGAECIFKAKAIVNGESAHAV